MLFVITDTTSQRILEKTTLGEVQQQWLFDRMNAVALGEYAALVWVSTLPWIDDFYKWGEFASERQSIAEKVVELSLSKKMIMLSGDAHMVAVDDGTHAKGGFPVFHAAALDAKPTTKVGACCLLQLNLTV